MKDFEFKNKEHFVNFASKYFGVYLENDKKNVLNNKRKYLYTNLGKGNYDFKNYLLKNGYPFEEHCNGYYWIKFKK